jgi:arginyl-tRNA synthetase
MEAHGDFSTNVAMVMASTQRMTPRKIAEGIVGAIDPLADPEGVVARTEIAGPGFINFFITPTAWGPVLEKVYAAGDRYGASKMGEGRKVQVEFVSANPTGPLHVGHGRGAAVGDTVANILSFCGFDVQKEYYINDSGRQIRTLGRSVLFRYKERAGESVTFPEACYQGEYVRELADAIYQDRGDALFGESEEDAVAYCARRAATAILSGISSDLGAFGIEFDRWFSEQSLFDDGKVPEVIADLREKAKAYEKEGALWFRSTEYGDEKDRVVIRGNGQTTYFASDIAYHRDKFQRGFDRVIDVWGADHHGYVARMSAAVQAMGTDKERFQVILVHLVNLLRAGRPVAMSTRAGEFVTLREVVDEVGADAARFLFLTRHYESPLDFDLELAKKKSNDNPVYYVQYVHARISSILSKGMDEGILAGEAPAPPDSAVLREPEEIALIKALSRYPEVVEKSAILLEPHRVTYYLMSLATLFHAYYNKHRVLTDEGDLARARLYLVLAIRQVIRNGLSLLGVSAPEKM